MNVSTGKKTWYWKQGKGKYLKVISDSKKGYIKVYNEKNELVLNKQNLTKEQIILIEENFLHIVVNFPDEKKNHQSSSFDPMIS